MGAPNASLLAALRNPKVAVVRHLFFELAHSQGTVRAWDGIGDIVVDGDTYTGVGDLASLTGVSQTRELQSHSVEATLQGVSLDALRITDQDVRGDAAEIRAMWFDEDGNSYGPRTLFAGKGENLSIVIDGSTCTVKIRLRGPMADWSRPPAAYYTPGDQDRLFSGDTGMRFIPGLENATTSGWSTNEETSGGRPTLYAQSAYSGGYLTGYFDDVTLAPVGDNTLGFGGIARSANQIYALGSSPNEYYEENGTGVIAQCAGAGSPITIGGVATYVDTSGDVRSAGGELLERDDVTNYELRRQGAIASVGAATAETVTYTTLKAHKSSKADWRVGTDCTGLIYCNKFGFEPSVDTSPASPQMCLGGEIANVSAGSRRYYAEAGTGNAVTFNGSGVMQCNGANVTVSDTGALRTNTGNYIVWDGDADAFLRVWT